MAKVVRAGSLLILVGVPAAAVIGLGFEALEGWLQQRPSWSAAALPQSVAMVAATAIGFIVAGVGLAARLRHTLATQWIARACGVAILLLGAVGLAEHALGIPLGLDFVQLHRGLDVNNPTPGRMSPPTAIAFMLAGAVIAGLDLPRRRSQAFVIQILTGALLALGLVSLVVYDISPEGLLPWYRYNRMAAQTAGGFVAVAVALLALIGRTRWYASLYHGHEDEKILILVLGILSLVATSMSAATFVTMQHNLEDVVNGTLTHAVSDRVTILENLFDNRLTRAMIVTTRPSFIESLAAWRSHRDPASRQRIEAEMASYLGSGFRSLTVVDTEGVVVASAGAPPRVPAIQVPLANRAVPTTFLWDGTFVLRTQVPVWRGPELLGTVESDQPLEVLPRLQQGAAELGRSAEWVICGADGARMACFPRRTQPRPDLLERARDGSPLPMDRALRGHSGVIVADDYRGDRVIAGYAPIGGTGLAIVLKERLDEFYAPLRDQLSLWWRWFLAVSLLGALLVGSQVRPVAQRLVHSEAVSRTRSEALLRSERALRELYASLGDGIIVLRPDGTIEFVNRAAERLFGYGAADLVGRPVGLLIPEELRESHAQATRRFIEEGTSNVLGAGSLVFPAVRRDGSRFDLEFSLASMRQGDELRLVAVLRDVSQRVALDRMKSEFIATVSHELRTPLTSIVGSLAMLREVEAMPREATEFVEMASRNSDRLAELVNDVIDAERIESGALQFDATCFPIGEFLAESVRLNQSYAAAHGVFFYLEEPLPDAWVEADRGRLMQVMANLLSNAAKFSPRGEEVLVRARREGERVRVEVADRGRGIPDEFRPRAFTRFAQADSSDHREKGGTGLGLAICKAIIDRLGGTIGVDSRPGEGSTFWFELAAAPRGDASAPS